MQLEKNMSFLKTSKTLPKFTESCDVLDDIETFDLKSLKNIGSTSIFGKDMHLKLNLLKNILIENMSEYDQCFVLGYPEGSGFEEIVGKENVLKHDSVSAKLIDTFMNECREKKILLILNQPDFESDAQLTYLKMIYLYANKNISIISDFVSISEDSPKFFSNSDCLIIFDETSTSSYFSFKPNIILKSGLDISQNQLIQRMKKQNLAFVLKKQIIGEKDLVFKYDVLNEPKKKIEVNKSMSSFETKIQTMLQSLHERLDIIEKNAENQKLKMIETLENLPITQGMSILVTGDDYSRKSNLILNLIKSVQNQYDEIYLNTEDISEESLVNMDNLKNISNHDAEKVMDQLIKKQKKIRGSYYTGKPALFVVDDVVSTMSKFSKMEYLKDIKSCGIDIIFSTGKNYSVLLEYFDLILQKVNTDGDRVKKSYTLKKCSKKKLCMHENVCKFAGKKSDFKTKSDFMKTIRMSAQSDDSWLCIFKKEHNKPLSLYEPSDEPL